MSGVRSRRPRVALIIETSLAPGREMLAGVARYAREHGPWSTVWAPRGLEESIPRWLERWSGDGVVARIQSEVTARAVLDLNLPAVDVLGVLASPRLPLVHTDDAAIAKLAADHLISRGFRSFAFYGWTGEPWSERRGHAFTALIRDAGYPCEVFETPHHVLHTQPWEANVSKLAGWVRSLPKPAGLMLCTDQCGPIVLEACRTAGAAVPDDIAVVGVDNDEALCETSDPPLTSIWPDHFGVGYEAAAMLDRLMSGERVPARPVLLPPREIVTRHSSDALAIDDRDVAAAVRYIRERACDGVSINEVAGEVGVSRSVLQRRFRAAVGHSPHVEVIRVRLNRAKELLAHTDLPIADIAVKAGFKHQEYLGVVFRERFGTTPAKFRKQSRS